MDNQMMTIHRAWRAALITTLLLTATAAPATEKVTYYRFKGSGLRGHPLADLPQVGAVNRANDVDDAKD